MNMIVVVCPCPSQRVGSSSHPPDDRGDVLSRSSSRSSWWSHLSRVDCRACSTSTQHCCCCCWWWWWRRRWCQRHATQRHRYPLTTHLHCLEQRTNERLCCEWWHMKTIVTCMYSCCMIRCIAVRLIGYCWLFLDILTSRPISLTKQSLKVRFYSDPVAHVTWRSWNKD